MGRLDNKVAIVTGAGSGIGRAAAVLFAKEGAKVVVVDFVDEGGQHTVELIRKAGGEAIFVRGDVSSEEDIKKMVDAAVDTYGMINILYNHAGLWTCKRLPDLTDEDFNKSFAINVRAAWLGMKYAIPEMNKVGGGSVINTASICADLGWHGTFFYGASKAALVQMSRVAAVEYAPQNIRVNCIKPGCIGTPGLLRALDSKTLETINRETPQGRLGKPDEVAQLALFLASDESSHITGVDIAVDGGIEASSHISRAE